MTAVVRWVVSCSAIYVHSKPKAGGGSLRSSSSMAAIVWPVETPGFGAPWT